MKSGTPRVTEKMLCVSKLHLTNPAAHPGFKYNFTGNRHYSALGRPYGLRLPLQRLSASSSVRPVNGSTAPSTSEPSLESHYSSAVGCSSPLQLSHWNLTQRHVRILNFIACAVSSFLLKLKCEIQARNGLKFCRIYYYLLF